MNKVILGDNRIVKEITLPSFEGSKVEIYSSILVGDIDGVNLHDKSNSNEFVKLLPKMIKSWNFTDAEGNDLPITVENIKKLPVTDLTVISDTVEQFQAQVKKN